MALSSIGSIANHISENFPNLPIGISGNLVEIVNLSLFNTENYTGQSIGSNSISETYQHAILNFAQADIIDLVYGQASTFLTSGVTHSVTTSEVSTVKLEGLSVEDGEGKTTISAVNALGGLGKSAADQFRKMAEGSLKNIGRKVNFGKTLA